MNIIVTGGSGLVGKQLKDILPDAVYISSKDYDLTDLQQVKDMMFMYEPNVVVHLAARVGGILDNVASGRYSMEEIAEEYKERERRIKEEEEDKERFKEYYQELEDNWQKEMYNLRLIRDNNPDRFIEHLINYEYFDEDGREQLELVCKELLV